MKNKEEINITQVWAEYEKGVMYNRRKGLYTDTERNYNFYHGKQWDGAVLGDVKPITLNIIKPIVKYKVGVLYDNSYNIVFNPNSVNVLEEYEQYKKMCDILNSFTNKIWELQQVDIKVREALKDACINSEGIIYCYYDEAENNIIVQCIDKNNICYGNEAESDMQSQPYIIIAFRRTIEAVKEEARSNGISEDEINNIVSDNEVEEQAGFDGFNDEISPMCLVLLKLYKKNGIVHSIKSTRNVIIQKETSHGLKSYPVAHMLWEDVKGSARGIGEVSPIINNNIELNKTATRRAIAVKLGAYPRAIVNSKYVKDIKSLQQVGATIKVESNEAIDDVRKQVGYLAPSNMSPDSKLLQDELMQNTRELAGAGDTVTGNVDPTQASGKAILAVQQSAKQPLTEQLNKYRRFIEDIAIILFDIYQTYYTDGILSPIDEQKQNDVINKLPYDILKEMKVNIKADVTPHSPFDRFAQEQSIENLMAQQKITFEEYVEALPFDSVMPKQTLQQILKKREEVKQQIQQMQEEVNNQMNALKQKINQEEGSEYINNLDAQGNQQLQQLASQLQQGGEEIAM